MEGRGHPQSSDRLLPKAAPKRWAEAAGCTASLPRCWPATGTEQPESRTAPSFRRGQLLCPVSAQVCSGTKQGSKRGDKVGFLSSEVLHLEQLCPGHQGAAGEGQPRGAEKGLQEDPGQPQRATLILQAGEGGTGAPPGCGGSSDAPDFGDAKFGGAQAMPSARHPCLELMNPAVRLPHPEPLKDVTSAALAQEWASCSFRSSPHPTHCSEICRKRVPSPLLIHSPHCVVSRTHGYFILWVMSRY